MAVQTVFGASRLGRSRSGRRSEAQGGAGCAWPDLARCGRGFFAAVQAGEFSGVFLRSTGKMAKIGTSGQSSSGLDATIQRRVAGKALLA